MYGCKFGKHLPIGSNDKVQESYFGQKSNSHADLENGVKVIYNCSILWHIPLK